MTEFVRDFKLKIRMSEIMGDLPEGADVRAEIQKAAIQACAEVGRDDVEEVASSYATKLGVAIDTDDPFFVAVFALSAYTSAMPGESDPVSARITLERITHMQCAEVGRNDATVLAAKIAKFMGLDGVELPEDWQIRDVSGYNMDPLPNDPIVAAIIEQYEANTSIGIVYNRGLLERVAHEQCAKADRTKEDAAVLAAQIAPHVGLRGVKTPDGWRDATPPRSGFPSYLTASGTRTEPSPEE